MSIPALSWPQATFSALIQEAGYHMKILPAIGILVCITFFPLLSHAQGVPKSLSPEGVEAGAFSVSSKKDSIGSVQIGSTKTDSVTVTNSGSTTLTISSVTSSNAQFKVGPVSAAILAGAKRKFGITYTPTSAGPQTSFIVFVHNGPTSPDTVTATGTGTVPAFSVNRKTVPYGFVVIGTGKPDSVSVTNTGTAALVISSVTSTNARYAVNPTSGTIQPGAKSTFQITFTPTVNGIQNGNIVFLHNAPTIRDTVAVSGTGTGFSVNRRTVAFGSVPVASPSKDSVVVTNAGAATLTISNVTSSNGSFVVSPASASILAAANAKFYITFTPGNTNPQTGNIVFTHTASSSPDTVTVSGAGIAPAFSVDRKNVPFGTVALGSNKLDSVSVTDTGKVALVISSVTSSNGTFAVNPANATIQPAQTMKFYITFTPGNTNPQSGNIVFNHNAPNAHDTVTVSGTGGAGGFSVTRRSVPFGTVPLGSNKLDSVSVTNTGGVALVISSVTSSNGTFAVNPANATIQPAQARTFYITFTPGNTNPQSGNIVFNHNAPSLHDTVTVSGTGGVAGFAVTRRSVPFGIVVLGNNKLDSVAVTDTGGVALVISSVTSSNGTFAVNPANATIQPTQATTFYITFTPGNANPQSGNIVFNHNAPNAHDTVAVSGTGLGALSPPVLLAPANGSTGQATTDSLKWNSVAGATGYWLQMATDPSFTTIVVTDSTLVSTGRQVSGLPQNTQYYWRVGTKNTVGFGLFSGAWTLTTVSSGAVSGTVSFSGDLSSTSYRMFGLPGIGSRKVGDILSGTEKIDWRMLSDNGKDTTYPFYYMDLTVDSALQTGEGYWLLQKTPLSISRTDILPPLATDGTYSIPLHSGWNLITDPFTASVLRTNLFAANGLPPSTVLWEHLGARDTATSSGTTFDPFKGYYFDNGLVNFATLKIPYPFGTSVAKFAKAPAMDWRVELVFDGDVNTDRDNFIGIAPTVKTGRNELDQHESPLVFDRGFLYFVRPEWDPVHPRFATDMRPGLGTGQTWDFEVWNPRKGGGKITLLGLEGIPPGNQVVLVDAMNTSPVDMRRSIVYTYQTSSAKMQFKLIVGTKEYADGEISKLTPQAYELAQNYPNPFNPSTTISYMIPAGTNVRLEILSVIGQRVRVLDEGYRAAATYSVIWDGKDEKGQTVSSGVYFCRLVAGGNVIRTRKLVLLR